MIKLWAVVAGLLISSIGFCQDEDDSDSNNFRGQCRKLISGHYADAWNESIRAKDALLASEAAKSRLEPQLSDTEKKLRDHLKQMKREPFNATSANKREELSAQEKVIHDQIVIAQDVRDKAKASQTKAEESHQKITKLIDKVFYRKFVPDPEGLPRKLFHRLDWKNPCPKYRSLCPLPAESAANLKKLASMIEDSDKVCMKYANYK